MNKVILMGRLTREPELRYSQGEKTMAIASFSLAVDRKYKKQGDEATADFFNCTAFGKLAEVTDKYLVKGSKILIAGRIQNDNYTNKEGQKVYGIRILVDELEFAESKANKGQGAKEDNEFPSIGDSAIDGFMNIPDGIEGSLPFN